ncbi:MerR family transcriptional regulator [Oryzobacter sp. R7]|uniref:transcriptional regulator FtsR n=1 Tax=Oryzobacter faecalis TaxID=3388656 RepID=UPI00398CBFDC
MPEEAAGRPLTVGAVVRALREEFPDVSISKVRFLEAEGLVTPTRTGSGYRQFSTADVDRIRYVLRAQRDLFWPLRVIRDNLDALDRGLTPGEGSDLRARAPEPAADPAVPAVDELVASTRMRLTRAELAAASGLHVAEVDDLVAHGLLRPGPDGHHGEADLRVARAAAGLAAHGLQARHLRPFRTAADREVGLVEQAVAGRRGPDAERRAAEVAHLCLTLHAALVRGGLRGTS